MAFSQVDYTGDGVTKDFTVTFDYLDQSHVIARVAKVFTDDVASGYNQEFINATTLRVTKKISGDAPDAGLEISVIRQTPIDTPAVVFGGGASLSSTNLNKNSEYLTYALQEATDANDSFTKVYLGDFAVAPTLDNDGEALQTGAIYFNTGDNNVYYYNGSTWSVGDIANLTSGYADAAAASETAAGLSEVAAAASEAAAAISETNAAASAVTAATFDPALFVAKAGDTMTGVLTNTAGVNSAGTRESASIRIESFKPTLLLKDNTTSATDFLIQGDAETLGVYLIPSANDDLTAGTIAARFDAGGTSSPASTTIITRQKGDTRYAQLGAANTFTENTIISGNLDVNGTEAIRVPRGTTAQRPGTPLVGDIRWNTTLGSYEGYDGSTWAPIGGGGLFKGDNGTVGLGSGDIFRINNKILTVSTTIAATENASATGPLEVDTGVTLTVTSGGTLAII